ncbi:glutamate-rich protein 6, partial [Biomphalaria glabrata]
YHGVGSLLEEGWTLRVPSPLNLDDPDTEIFVPEPFHPMALVSGQVQGREIIQKFYPNGTPFLIIFPDGTGNVFYPSGRIAILITSVTLGQNTYVVLDDSTESQILAVFDATGCGTCYFMDGKIRLNYDQQGGIELDLTGSRRRSWIWKDHETHVHAPPFQPIVFGMNYFLSVRVMSQENIALSLTGKKRSCRFNVGTKLKMVMPENYLDKFNEYQLYIDEHKLHIQSLMIKVNNLLKFPKSPKLDSMLPPVSLTSKQFKVNQKRQQLNSLSPRNKEERITKQHRLPPLDQTSVIVN